MLLIVSPIARRRSPDCFVVTHFVAPLIPRPPLPTDATIRHRPPPPPSPSLLYAISTPARPLSAPRFDAFTDPLLQLALSFPTPNPNINKTSIQPTALDPLFATNPTAKSWIKFWIVFV
ncbi:hypothetical protein U1Q18_040988 [Sarracenia purpurea var. burkii]